MRWTACWRHRRSVRAYRRENPCVAPLFRLLRSGWCQESGFQQLLCIRMLGGGKDTLRVSLFDHLAMLDHHQLVAQRTLSHQLMVVKHGQVVEQGDAQSIFAAPQHPYTQQLLEAAFLAPVAVD